MPLSLRRAPGALGLVAALGLLALAGCASSGEAIAYRSEVGRAPSGRVLAGTSAEVLEFYGYEVELAENDLVQTGWRYLPSGYRDRATVRVRPRGNDLFNGSIRVVVETQGEGGQWQTARPTAELRDQYGDLIEDIRTRLERYMTQN